jgi:hypothetical protein
LPFSHWTPDSRRCAIQAAGFALWSWSVEADAFIMNGRDFDMCRKDVTGKRNAVTRKCSRTTLADFLSAYRFGYRLKAMKSLTPRKLIRKR